jgi:hypothetical protein
MLATKEVPLSIANPFTGGLRFFLSSFKRIAVTLRSGLAIVLIGLSLGTFSNCASQEAIPPESGAFLTYLETSANSRDSGMSPQTPIDRQSLKLESLQLSEEYRTAHTPRREVLRSQLREMKWKAFEDL